MKIDDVFKLIDAGFTKDEILGLTKEAPDAPEAPAAPEEPAAPEAPEAPDMAKQFETALNGILDSFKAVAADIKAANIHSSRMPDVSPETPEDILATVIGIKEK